MDNMKQCRFKFYLTELEPPVSPSCWEKKKKKRTDCFKKNSVTQRAGNIQQTEEEDAQHQLFNRCQGNWQGHLWCCARKECPEKSQDYWSPAAAVRFLLMSKAWPDWIPLRIGEWIKLEKGSRFVLVITYSHRWAEDLLLAVSAKSTTSVCTVWMLKRLQMRNLRQLRTTFRNNLRSPRSNHSNPVKEKCFLGLLHCL